jgi:hypothetical protein
MEIQSRVNLEYDLRLFPHGKALLERIERLGESTWAKDHHVVVRKTGIAPLSVTTERIVHPSFNFLILVISASGQPESVFRNVALSLSDGTTGRVYWGSPGPAGLRGVRAPLVGGVLGTVPLWGIPILLLKGRPLDLTIRNRSTTQALDLLEIVFRGVRF